MKKIVACLLFTALLTPTAFALPPIPKYLPDVLKSEADSQAFAEVFDKMEGKCSVCHIPMADKKAKGHGLNDFGKAMHRTLDHKAFLAADKEKMTEEASKILKAAWVKALEAKNEAGITFGSLVKEGKNPATNPVK